ncbi:hypothetical protein TNCV_4973601 [Trichonephila clavipes]|uniref:Uncharacterized protein n=1 Tax=Trichonephila clavipes TaxID=2585209 RepID=A0A8X6SI59_TRICX|nr:hypothetical protein TNCV_4973601 [Trichonephila clavipes]
MDKLSPPNHLEKEIQQWLNALKPQRKVDLVTESYLLLLFMLHLRFIYEKFPVKMFEIKFNALKMAESPFWKRWMNASHGPESVSTTYYAILGISATVMGGCLCKLLG